MRTPPGLVPSLTLLATLLLACGGGGGGGEPSSGLICTDGQIACGNACVNPKTNPENCGVCGHACGLGTCVDGACVCETAPLATTSCGAAASPECVDTAGDSANCGTCGHACAAEKPGSQCSGGTCQCLAPRADACGSTCTDLQTDASNCKTCGHVCPLTNDVCIGGACQCPASLPDVCGSSPGTCVSLAKDASNCGTCGHACPAGATCTGGKCQCPSATPDVCTVSNTCANLKTDLKNCGTCGNACPTGATCTTPTNATTSQCACPAGNIVCGASPGQCCAGNGCCTGGACQLPHANGLGQSYYDCGALDEHTQNQAIAAAQAWAPTGTVVDTTIGNCPSCKCTTKGTQTAVWCYAGSPAAGRVGLYDVPSCTAFPGCPQQGASNVFTWR